MQQRNLALFGAVKRSLFNLIRQQIRPPRHRLAKRFFASGLLPLAVLAGGAAPAGAETFQVLEDTYSTSGLVSKSSGSAATLLVGPKNTAYIKFDLTNSGLTASEVADARLTLYFPGVPAPGTLMFFANTSDFSESPKTPVPAPTQNPTNLASLAVATADKQNFLTIDVTAQVQAWLAGSMPDYGFAITSTNGAKITLGAKEGPATGFPAVLEVDAVSTSFVGTNATLSGNVTAASFSGDGSGLTSLNASQLTTGTVPFAQLPAGLITNTETGVTLTGDFTGDGGGLTNLNVAQLNEPISLAQLPGAVVTNNEASVTLSNLTLTGNLNLVNNNGNTAIGYDALYSTSGSNNTAVGSYAGASLLGAESYNIDIGNNGVAGDNGVSRIGTPGVQTNAFIAGVIYGDGSGLSNFSVAQLPAAVVTNTETGVTFGGVFAGTLTGNATTATTASNVVSGLAITNAIITQSTFAGDGSGLTNLNASQLSGGTVPLAQLPAAVLTNNEASVTLSNLTLAGGLTLPVNNNNTALGNQSFAADTTGADNTALGNSALYNNTVGSDNTAIGAGALYDNVSGGYNTAIGLNTLAGNLNGTNDIALGYLSGSAFSKSESCNIDIGNSGVAGENGITRIGTLGVQTNAFIAGVIYGDGSGLSNLSIAQFPTVSVTNTESGLTLGGVFTGSLTGNATTATTASNVVSGLAITNATITQSTFAGDGSGLTNLNASQISSGTIPVSQLPAVVITNNATNLILGPANEIAPLTIPPNIPSSAVGSVATGTSPIYVTVAGRYAYVANFTGGTLQIIDVSKPATPVSTGTISTGALPYCVAVAGRYACVVSFGTSALQVIDVSNPWAPVSVGSVSTLSAPIALAVAGHYAYVVDFIANTLLVFDVSNPSAPVNVGSVGTGNGPHSVTVVGRYAYVVNANGDTLQVFDVSNPAAPISVGSVGTGNYPVSVAVANGYAYVANNSATNLQVFDVSNPTAPVSVGIAATGSHPDSVAVAGRYAYVANNTANSLQVFDVSNPSSPVGVGSFATSSGSASLAVAGRYAYVVNGGGTMQIFDMGGAYIQHLETGTMVAGTLQTRDTMLVGNNLNVSGGLTVSGSALFSAGLSVNNGAITASNITAANISAATISGNGGALTNLSISAAELPVAVVTNNQTGVILSNLTITGTLTLPVNNNNTAIGNQTLDQSANGTNNIALGYEAGSAFTGTESSNIDIGNTGTMGENGIIRIGTTGVQTATYLAGTVYADNVALTSDRNAKENFTPIDAEVVLTKVASLPMTEWNYKKDSKALRHIGPMAQDFQAAFGLNGSDDKHLTTVDEGGVALAAIQGLNEKLREKDAEIGKLEKRLTDLENAVQSMTAKK